jgi:cytochrome b6-f complex iron-sulfur subunit
MNRKDFLKSSVALCGLSLIPTGVIQSCKKQDFSGPSNVNFTLDLSQSANATLNNVGGALVANGVLVIRLDTATFSAVSDTCTHQGCSVGYSSAQGKVVCPCHGASFNASTGAVLGGPAPSALTKYSTTLSGNILTVKSI